jgi:RNA polymerase sigma factor, sigma-70 family
MAEIKRGFIEQQSVFEIVGLVRMAKRDPREFAALYRQYVKPVYGYLFSHLGNVHDAEDVTAQTFLAAFETLGTLRQEEYFASWLFSIARNKAMDRFRKQRSEVSLDEVAEPSIEKDPLTEVIHSEQTLLLKRLITGLPDEERELLRLRFLAGLSFAEMARLLGRNEETVKKSLYRLLARLHEQVEVVND